MQRLLEVIEAVVERRGDRRELVDGRAEASRLSDNEAVTSSTAVLRSRDRCATSSGSLANSAVTEARLWLSCRIKSALSCSADTSIDRFLTVANMSPAVVAER